LYRDKDPVMALDDLLAPMAIFFAFSVPNLGEGNPSISILRLERSTGNEMAFSCGFAD
jgi:hypothetical protein